MTMTTKIRGAALVVLVIPMLGGGCDGRTIIGSPQTGTGGSAVTGVGGATGTVGIGGATGQGGAVVTSQGGATGQGGGGATSSGGAPGSGGAGGGGANTCPVAGAAATPTTIAGMRAALSRDWILCSPLGLTHQTQVGIRITTADRYALLGLDATGTVVAMTGADVEGSLEYLQLGNRVQVNFRSDIGYTVISGPVVTANPAMLIINNNGVYEYRYVSADEHPTGGTGGGANGGAPGMGTCPVAGVAVTPTTVEGLRTALSRRWILCSPLGLTQQPQAGIEITTAGRYALLGLDPTGIVTPMHGVDFEGSVAYLPPSQISGGLIQVNFAPDIGGSISVHVVITQNPTMLIIPGGSSVYRYVLPDGS